MAAARLLVHSESGSVSADVQAINRGKDGPPELRFEPLSGELAHWFVDALGDDEDLEVIVRKVKRKKP